MSVEKLIASKNPIKIWIAARYFYRIGDPIITDELYEEYTTLLKEHPKRKTQKRVQKKVLQQTKAFKQATVIAKVVSTKREL